ncbi:hypothetical protein [Streptomyces pseudovenezuelae]
MIASIQDLLSAISGIPLDLEIPDARLSWNSTEPIPWALDLVLKLLGR